MVNRCAHHLICELTFEIERKFSLFLRLSEREREREKKSFCTIPQIKSKKFVVVCLCATHKWNISLVQCEANDKAKKECDRKRFEETGRGTVNSKPSFMITSPKRLYSDLYFDFNLCVSLSFFFVASIERTQAWFFFALNFSFY